MKSPGQQKAESAPPPAYELHDGDALAILGDNFLVDSRIEVTSAAQTFRLFRVDTVPDRWLCVPNQHDATLALVTVSTDAFNEQSLAVGSMTYANEASGTGSSEIAGAGGKSSSLAVAFWLLRAVDNPAGRAVVLKWGGPTQVFTGSEVHPGDVEIFGPAKTS